MRRNVAVIGLGIFGFKVAMEIEHTGRVSVLAVDSDPKKVDRIKEHVTQAVVGDVTDEDVIQELDVAKFDQIVVAMGSHLQSQILAITFLKRQGAKTILAKANSSVQRDILLKVGADEVILPEEEFALFLAKKVSYPNINDLYPFADGFMANITVPERMVGFTIKELDLRLKHRMSIILYKKLGETPKILWNPNTVLNSGDELTILAETDNIAEVFGD